ncbi:MAG: redox-sensing transcriptional repressor Rex [Chitinivibrionales bacterium]|nr:redox-sensing transcriptional repressor Rex [Chitinivibrionales bacterium]
MARRLSLPALERLCTTYRLLQDLMNVDKGWISSKELGVLLGVGAHLVRKDINILGEIGNTRAGYNVRVLHSFIEKRLQLQIKRQACIIGLGKLGSACLASDVFASAGYPIVAGFDADAALLKSIQTSIPVFLADECAEVVKRLNIELGIIAVPKDAAQKVAEQLVAGGVKGIVNFTPAIIVSMPKQVHVIQMDLQHAFMVLSSRMTVDEKKGS